MRYRPVVCLEGGGRHDHSGDDARQPARQSHPGGGNTIRFAHDLGLDGDVVHSVAAGIASPSYSNSYYDVVLWTQQGGGWATERVHDAQAAGSEASCPILPGQGCCDRLAYTVVSSSGQATVRVTTRSGETWAYADVGEPVALKPPSSSPHCLATAMSVVDDTTYLSVVTSDAIIVYQGGEDGWQEHRIETDAEAVSADLVVDGQGAVHLVYEVGDAKSGANGDIYYAAQTCQPEG